MTPPTNAAAPAFSPVERDRSDSGAGWVTVTRRINAPAARIFRILTDPARHLELDGSGMLRGAVTDAVITGIGDVFVMKMYYSVYGDYEMNNRVVEFDPDRRVGWAPAVGRGHPDEFSGEPEWGHRWSYQLVPLGPAATEVTETFDCSTVPAQARDSMNDGLVWMDSMRRTLERLDAVATRRTVDRRRW